MRMFVIWQRDRSFGCSGGNFIADGAFAGGSQWHPTTTVRR